MENPRPEKVAIVDEVKQKLSDSSAALLTEYRGMSVKELQQLRQAAAGAGAEIKVYKNTLVRFAARDLGLEALEPLLVGPTAVAFVEADAAAAAKVLRDFARTQPLLVIKGALLGDKVVDAAGARALADLPSREALLSQIAGLFAAPASQFASLLEAVPKSFLFAVQALIEKGGADGAPAAAAGSADDAPTEPAPAGDAASSAPAGDAPADDAPAADAADAPAEASSPDEA